MTCDDRLDDWNDQLDRGQRGPWSPGPGWDPHASDCGRCRATDAGFEALRGSIEQWASAGPAPPEVGPALLRLEAARRRRASARRVARLGVPLGLAASAALIVLVPISRPPRPIPALAATAAPGPLASALGATGRASLALAVEVAGPASRIGPSLVALARAAPEAGPFPAPVPVAPPRPIGRSARQAFDFLLRATADDRGPIEAGRGL